MKASECKICGVREHNHVCAASKAARRVGVGPGDDDASMISRVARSDGPLDPEVDMTAYEITPYGLTGRKIPHPGEAARMAALYAPDGHCEWCDRRRAAEAARIRVWRAKKRGGS